MRGRASVTVCSAMAMAARGAVAACCLGVAAAPALAIEGYGLVEQARALEHGEGVARDPARAAALYCRAVAEGDAEAMYALGWMYANGRAGERNDSLASTLFAMAAFEGHAQARAMLDHLGRHRGEVPECLLAELAEPAPPADEASWSVDIALAGASAGQRPLIALVARLAPQFGIEPRLALALAQSESGFDPGALSPKRAMGLMQLIPETAERFNVRDAFDPEQNVRGGLAYLRWLLAYFRGDVTLAVAGYNAGERAVDRYRGVPPYPETRAYVARVRALFPAERHRYPEGLAEPSPLLGVIASAGR